MAPLQIAAYGHGESGHIVAQVGKGRIANVGLCSRHADNDGDDGTRNDIIAILPADLLVYLWPLERVLSGVQVCKVLNQVGRGTPPPPSSLSSLFSLSAIPHPSPLPPPSHPIPPQALSRAAIILPQNFSAQTLNLTPQRSILTPKPFLSPPPASRLTSGFR
jgi:hypothetical protein